MAFSVIIPWISVPPPALFMDAALDDRLQLFIGGIVIGFTLGAILGRLMMDRIDKK
jgi:NhaP-type Na+/H+ or K+/H+ antiporter